MDTGTPLTNRIGVQYISFARHESHFCPCPTQGPRGIPSWRSNASRGASLIGSKGLLAGARPVRSSRKVCHSCLWVCLWRNYPGDERDFRPYWSWRVNFQFINNGWPITINGAGLFAKHISHFYSSPTPGPRGNCLEGQMLQGGLFNWFKMTLVSWCKKPGRGSRRGFPSGLWVCLSGNYPGDEWDFHPYWYWRANFPVYQQCLTCNHQWCWAATSCPELGT